MADAVIIDSNLLCLLAVGRLGAESIGRHWRLHAYSHADYELLVRILGGFGTWVTTPHILAETSNLLRQTANSLAGYASASLAELISRSDERSVPAVRVVESPDYLRLGVTDAAILTLMSEGCHLLSADLGLYLAASTAGYSAFNFNHLRYTAE